MSIDCVGDLDAGVAGRQQPHQHRAADRGVGVGGIRRVPPASQRVLLLRRDRRADGQLEGLADRPRPFAVGPEVPLVHGAIGFGQAEHGEAVMIHALPHDARGGVLGGDEVAKRPPDVVAVQPEIGIFARGQEDHQPQADGPRPVLVSAAGPVALLGLLRGQVLQAAIVHLAHVARDDLAELRAGKLRLCPASQCQRAPASDRQGRWRCGSPSGGSRGPVFSVTIFGVS